MFDTTRRQLLGGAGLAGLASALPILPAAAETAPEGSTRKPWFS